MGDAIDDAMEDDVGETEEEEGDRILEEVLAEIGVSVGQQVRSRICRPLAALADGRFRLFSSAKHRPHSPPRKSPNQAFVVQSQSANRLDLLLVVGQRVAQDQQVETLDWTTCRRGWTT